MSETPAFSRQYFTCEKTAKLEILNPNFRRPQTASRERMDALAAKAAKGPITVQDALDCGYVMGNLKWEWMHGAIAIEGAGMVERKQKTAEEKAAEKEAKAAERAKAKAERDAKRAAEKEAKAKAREEAKAQKAAEREQKKAEREAAKAKAAAERAAAKDAAAQAAQPSA